MKLSEYISGYRKNHHLSLRALADQCGVSYQYINKLEKDEIEKPSLEFLSRLAKGTGITLQELLTIVDDFAIDLRSDTPLLQGKNEVINRSIEKLNTMSADDISFIESIIDTYINKFH